MRTLAMMALAVGCSSSSAPPAPEHAPASMSTAPAPLTLVYVPRRVGDRFHDVQHARYDLVEGGVHVVEVRDVECDREVRATDGAAVTSEASHYTTFHFEHTQDGRVSVAPALDGMAYLVTRRGDGLEIARDDGAPLGAEERTMVEHDHDDVKRPSGVSPYLAGRTWEVGREVTLDDAEQRGFFFQPAVGTASMTLTSVTPERAHFATHSHRRFDDGVEADVTGTMVIDRATGRLVQQIAAWTFTGAWVGHAELTTEFSER